MDKSNNKNGEHTACFKMLNSWHYYMSLTVHAFNNFMCEWIVDVRDFYILHSRTSDGPFLMFESTNRPPIIYDTTVIGFKKYWICWDQGPAQSFSQSNEPPILLEHLIPLTANNPTSCRDGKDILGTH